MNSIAIFSLGNLTDEQKEEFLALSKVGKAVFLESGQVDLYNRLRNIDLAELQAVANVWIFPDKLEDEDQSAYNDRVRVPGIQAFNNLKQGNIDAIWLSEPGFNILSQQPEYIAL
jgi:hypothetical protein